MVLLAFLMSFSWKSAKTRHQLLLPFLIVLWRHFDQVTHVRVTQLSQTACSIRQTEVCLFGGVHATREPEITRRCKRLVEANKTTFRAYTDAAVEILYTNLILSFAVFFFVFFVDFRLY